jgi:hypothetical protein
MGHSLHTAKAERSAALTALQAKKAMDTVAGNSGAPGQPEPTKDAARD